MGIRCYMAAYLFLLGSLPGKRPASVQPNRRATSRIRPAIGNPKPPMPKTQQVRSHACTGSTRKESISV